MKQATFFIICTFLVLCQLYITAYASDDSITQDSVQEDTSAAVDEAAAEELDPEAWRQSVVMWNKMAKKVKKQYLRMSPLHQSNIVQFFSRLYNDLVELSSA